MTIERSEKLETRQKGFSLIELIVVIVLLGIMSIVVAPKFIDLSSEAKIKKLENIAAQIRTTNKLVQAKARVKGLVPTSVNSDATQNARIVDFGFGSVELHYSTLCPEARGEKADRLNFIDFMNISLDRDLSYNDDNQYVRIGFDIPTSGNATNGCYVRYDSFNLDCEVSIFTTTC